MQKENRVCQNCKKDFIIESDDFGFYEKMGVPAPTFCPKCRRIRRLLFSNPYFLYWRECFLCDKRFISIYSKEKPFKVLCPKCFHGDGWDSDSYGVDYNPDKSFFEQIFELHQKMPILGIVNDNDIASVNCMYTSDVAFSKNCSMVFIAWRLENVLYSSRLGAGKDLCDCLGVLEESQFTYEGVFIDNVSNSKNIYWSASCVDCHFVYDLRGCVDCFMCFGLRNKKYCFKNKQYEKEEYERILVSYEMYTRTGYKKAKNEYQEFIKDYPRKFAELRNCVNCTGTDMSNSKNTKSSNMASGSENSKFVHNGIAFNTCYDCEVGGETELAYECITPDQSYKSLVTVICWKCNNASYSLDCHSCQNILGCVGLKKGEYCILNKRYSKEEYEKLYEIIKTDMKQRGEWGEFFPSKFSPFGLNETRANEELEFSKDEALAKGYKWQDDIHQTRGKETISQDSVPDSISEVEDKITEEILACVKCDRNYKILPQELLFYRRMKIPIPQKCFFCRHKERESMRPGYDLSNRQCDCVKENHVHKGKCVNEFETLFMDKETRPIHCKECYQKEIY